MNAENRTSGLFRATLLVAALVVAGCATVPEIDAKQIPVAPAQFKEGGHWTVAAAAVAQPRGEWWKAFGDPVLDELMTRAIERNDRIQIAAAIEASRLRLRPILMTSVAFVMGVLPLAFSTGAGAEMRQAMGIAVFSGMIGVTLFGLFLTPVFYVLLRAATGNRPLKLHGEVGHVEAFAGSSD